MPTEKSKMLEELLECAIETYQTNIKEFNEIADQNNDYVLEKRDDLSNNENLRFIKNYNGNKKIDFCVKNIDGEDYILISPGAYESDKGTIHSAGLGLAIKKNEENEDMFHLYGFVSDESGRNHKISEFEHACRTGGETGITGALFTIVNYMHSINGNSTLFQVLPHLNSAIINASKEMGISLPKYTNEQKEMLSFQLEKSIENILHLELVEKKKIDPIKQEEEFKYLKDYESILHLEFSSALTNYSGLAKKEEVLEKIIMPNLTKYLLNSLLPEYAFNGYRELRHNIFLSLALISNKYPSASKKIFENISDSIFYLNEMISIMIDNEIVVSKDSEFYNSWMSSFFKHGNIDKIKKMAGIMNDNNMEIPKNSEFYMLSFNSLIEKKNYSGFAELVAFMNNNMAISKDSEVCKIGLNLIERHNYWGFMELIDSMKDKKINTDFIKNPEFYDCYEDSLKNLRKISNLNGEYFTNQWVDFLKNNDIIQTM